MDAFKCNFKHYAENCLQAQKHNLVKKMLDYSPVDYDNLNSIRIMKIEIQAAQDHTISI